MCDAVRLGRCPIFLVLTTHHDAGGRLQRGGVFDLSSSIKQLDDELAVITRGLARLDTPAGEWGREA